MFWAFQCGQERINLDLSLSPHGNIPPFPSFPQDQFTPVAVGAVLGFFNAQTAGPVFPAIITFLGNFCSFNLNSLHCLCWAKVKSR